MLGLDMTLDLSSGWEMLPWLAASLLALAWLRYKGGPSLPRSRHWALWLCRGLALVLLAIICLNPVHVSVTPAPLHRPEVHILLDSSQSMRLGKPETRWQEATTLLRSAIERQNGHADIRIHRFGERLVQVDLDAFRTGGNLAGPSDADTQLAAAFRQLAARLGREAPKSVVVISDGRVRESEKLEEMTS